MAVGNTMDEDEIRAVLRPFCERVGREVKPTPLDDSDLLVRFMGSQFNFIEIRRAIAETRVAIARSRRPGSSSKKELEKLEKKLTAFESDRHREIAKAASSQEFREARVKEIAAIRNQLEEWTEAQAMAERARSILARERLPRIERPADGSVRAMIETIENHVEAAPPSGSLILMGQEPRPAGEDFEPRSAYATGLNPHMFSASVRLHVAPLSDRGRAAEVDGAVPSRDALVMRLNESRRPVDESHWRKFEDILPLAARQEIRPIIPTCIPFSSPYSTLRTLLSTDSWRAVRNAANDRNNGTCVVCGMVAAGEVRAEWSFLEPPRGSTAYGIQRLKDVRPYCSSCARVAFPAPKEMISLAPSLEGYERSREVFVVNTVMRRLSRVNRWEEDASPDPLAQAISIAQEAYQRRSGVRWALDLSILHGMNVSLHPDMVMHRKGWVMRKTDVPLFEEQRSVHLTRIFGASFVNSDGRRSFFELPPIHLVPWDTSVEQVWGEAPVSAALQATVAEPDFVEPAGPLNPDEEDYVVEEGPPFSLS